MRDVALLATIKQPKSQAKLLRLGSSAHQAALLVFNSGLLLERGCEECQRSISKFAFSFRPLRGILPPEPTFLWHSCPKAVFRQLQQQSGMLRLHTLKSRLACLQMLQNRPLQSACSCSPCCQRWLLERPWWSFQRFCQRCPGQPGLLGL